MARCGDLDGQGGLVGWMGGAAGGESFYPWTVVQAVHARPGVLPFERAKTAQILNSASLALDLTVTFAFAFATPLSVPCGVRP